MPTFTQAIDKGAIRLRVSDVEHERQTAGVLLAHVLGIDRTHLLTGSEEQVSGTDYEIYLRLIERRAGGEPLQYITGRQEFYGLDFIVTPDVLIPRPETESLIERVNRLIIDSTMQTPLVVDIGTGSGCIAVSVAINSPRAKVIATDISARALSVARTNAERHGVRERLEFLEGDLFEPLARSGLQGAIDIVASNPPYIGESELALTQREVRDWEPRTALFGGPDGLDVYRRLLADGGTYLKPGGYLAIEIGYGQAEPIKELIAATSWKFVDVIPDLQGIARTLTLRKPSEKS